MPKHASAQSDRDAAIGIGKVPRAHLVGIGGTGMRSLADVLDAAGWAISGSDANPETLVGSRYAVHAGAQAQAIDDALDMVVYSDAVPAGHPELARARQLQVATVSYPQMLGRLMESRSGVAIAGTHGKSTATAMCGEILTAAGFDPTVIFGARPMAGCSGGRLGRGRWMLAEACEYRANFCHLKPQMAVILGIEPDHFDCFASMAELEQAFSRFAQGVASDGLVLARHDCDATRRVVETLDCHCESFGFTPAATWHASALRERRGFYWFQVRCRERLLCDVKLPMPGRHNVLNAVAAAALASHCGATGTAIRDGLERFAGLQRRLEGVQDDGPIAILDDYAHHPSEITATLATVRQMYPGRRVWCVFQPHQVSRTRTLLDEFAGSLHNADKIIVTKIVPAREPEETTDEVIVAQLVARVAATGTDVVYLPTAADIEHHLQLSLRPTDVLITLGAGDIGRVAHGLGQRFGKIRKAG